MIKIIKIITFSNACNSVLGRWRLENQEFKVTLVYTVSIRTAWTTEEYLSKTKHITEIPL